MPAGGDRRKPSLDMRKERASNVRATPRWGEMGGRNREVTWLLASRIPQVLLALGDRSVYRSLPSTERTRSGHWGRKLVPGGRRRCGQRPDLYVEDSIGLGRQRHLPGDVPGLEGHRRGDVRRPDQD